MIKLRKPLYFTEVGRKDNQEDYLFPSKVDAKTKIFILCDSIGRYKNGETASKKMATTLGKYLYLCSEISIPEFCACLSKTYDVLDETDINSAKTILSNLACLCLNDNSYIIAHIGDSRIYHLRPSLYNPKVKEECIIYQSPNHSEANEILNPKEASDEESRDFPQKNVKTKSMHSHLKKRRLADVFRFDDIQVGDYFFLCSDGVLEQLSNEMLCEIIADKDLNDEKKLAKIKSICDDKTNDNYSCWLVPIDR